MNRMDLNPEDVIIEHVYHGSGNGSSFVATHLPTGTRVGERVPTDSTESSRTIQNRVIAALKLMIRDGLKDEG
jgi:hypothetical protein